MPKEYDVIVVGSGAGGATVAREMARRGKSVLILEPELCKECCRAGRLIRRP
jgi:choline dehydrogenase-like flavoprotein